MKSKQLQAYAVGDYLGEGRPEVLNELRPIFAQLIRDLDSLPEHAGSESILACFERAVLQINEHDVQIETIERETILQAVYALGQIAGLDPASQFAERWRGDW